MKGRQAILSRWAIHETAGYGLGINTSGHLEFWVGDGRETDAIAAEVPLLHHTWYFVAATYDPGCGDGHDPPAGGHQPVQRAGSARWRRSTTPRACGRSCA